MYLKKIIALLVILIVMLEVSGQKFEGLALTPPMFF